MIIRRDIPPGTSDPVVRLVRSKYCIYPESDVWDERFEQRVRGLQVLFGMYPSGVLDQETIDRMGI